MATKDTTRGELLEHGTRLMLERGYNTTGVAAVLEAAGVPKGSFYHYFKSKEEFGLAVLRHYFRNHLDNVERFLDDPAVAPLQRLRDCFGFYIDYFRDHDCRYGCMLGNLSQEMADQSEVFRSLLHDLLRTWCGKVADCLADAARRGELSLTVEPRVLAEYCVNSWEGAVLRMKLEKTVAPLELFVEMFFRTLPRPAGACH